MLNKFSKEKPPEKEKKPPELEIKFLLSGHATEEDLPLLRKNFENCDIYCPEIQEKGGEIEERLNLLSQGEISPEAIGFEMTFPRYFKALLELIHKSKKPIFLIDYSLEKHPHLTEELNELYSMGRYPNLLFWSGQLEEAICLRREMIDKDLKFQKDREKIMVENLKNLRSQIVEKYPQLKDKEKIKTLVTLGSFHTWPHHALKKEGEKTEKEFPFMPYLFRLEVELERRKRFFPEKEIKDEEIAKTFIEDYLVDFFFLPIRKSTDILAAAARIIVSKIDYSTIKKLSQKIKSASVTSSMDLIKFFEAKGIELPHSEEEIDKLVEEHQKKKFGQ